VSHELRTPLTSILGYVEMLAESNDLADGHVAMLDIVHRNAERLNTLVEDLLLLTRLGDTFGRLPRQTAPRVNEVVDMAARTIRPMVDRKEQRLVVDRHPDDPHVHADPGHLDRALMNLLSNASKYTPEGGEIRVAVGVRLRQVEIAVADTGFGISSTELSRLFTRFYRADSAVRSGSACTGLGLAIVKSLVELNGGRITVLSTPAMGSTFTLVLPKDKHAHLESGLTSSV
jgi:signal transduction histidine kinase